MVADTLVDSQAVCENLGTSCLNARLNCDRLAPNRLPVASLGNEWMPMSYVKAPVVALALVAMLSSLAAADDFTSQVLPFVKTYCAECHNARKSEGALDLSRYQSAAAIGEHFRQWEHVLTFLKKGEMPPEKAKQPTVEQRNAVINAIEGLMAADAKKWSGDPGLVLPRRLTAAEYNYSVRDLTGVDIRPAATWPVDPASGEGFNNTGEALVMSPNLFKKYYAAAQQVAEHVVFTPAGMTFAPFPVVTFADRMKLHEQAILRFYEQHNVNYEAYLTALWEFRYRSADQPATTLDEWAAAKKLSPKYLKTLSDVLSVAPGDDPFQLSALRRDWQALPGPSASDVASSSHAPTRQIAALVAAIRRASQLLCSKETPAIVSNASNGPVEHIARRTKMAAERATFDETLVADSRWLNLEVRKLQEKSEFKIYLRAADFTKSAGPGYVVLSSMTFTKQSARDFRPTRKALEQPLHEVLARHAPGEWECLKPGEHPLGHKIDPESIVLSTDAPVEITVPTKAFPGRNEIRFFVEAKLDHEHSKQELVRLVVAEQPRTPDQYGNLIAAPNSPLAAQLRAASLEFCRTFPNRFVYVDDTRGLSAGFHLIEGVFRDDQPLCQLVLGDAEKRDLDRLWAELYFGSGMMEKMLRGFVFFERSERNFLKHADFDPFKEEDPELAKDATLARFEEVYLRQSGVKLDDPELARHPIHLFFGGIRQGLKQRAEQFAAARPIYLRQLLEFAERAYRRPLVQAERQKVENFYHSVCDQPDLGIEHAVRGVLTSVLVSPHFCFRIDVPPAGQTVQPLSDIALASRLSYFLWSSLPDDELLSLAKAGKLNNEDTLRQQTRRMLKDPKVSGLALEFFGQWLRYRDFLEQESVDRNVFPAFNDALKQAMFEEPTRLITHLIQNDRPLTDVLYGDTTLVNKSLAAHYGWPGPASDVEWQTVDGIQKSGRGGVLGMAVFLTVNSQPQRTSPVKRGFWVVHKILGEHIPAPPNDVPPLPAKETETDGKTIRQLLAAHTQVEMCERCHRRFDPVGLSMEGFDPIGRTRLKDLAGRAVDNIVKLPSGRESHGVPEFLKHLQAERNDEFIKTLCHKFLGYALGRSVELSDHELLDEVQARLRREDYRFSTLFETVVCSAQFRQQRCKDFSIARFQAESKGD